MNRIALYAIMSALSALACLACGAATLLIVFWNAWFAAALAVLACTLAITAKRADRLKMQAIYGHTLGGQLHRGDTALSALQCARRDLHVAVYGIEDSRQEDRRRCA